jgi:hypothetical protein
VKIDFDSKTFAREMNNVMEYSVGFLNGVEKGRAGFLDNLGRTAIEALKEFIDSNARVDPELLAHVYEWYRVGSPDARLYDLAYTVNGASGLTINSTFRQSSSIKNGSSVPFYDKARIMEEGMPVVIQPKKSSVLAFDVDGEPVFTKSPVYIESPGGQSAEGGYSTIFNIFFERYFTQSFMISSGIFSHLSNPVDYKNNLKAGQTGGRSLGLRIGYQWISRGGLLQ